MECITRFSKLSIGFLAVTFFIGCASNNLKVDRSTLFSKSLSIVPAGKIEYLNITQFSGVTTLPIQSGSSANLIPIQNMESIQIANSGLGNQASQQGIYKIALDEIIKYFKVNSPNQSVVIAAPVMMDKFAKNLKTDDKQLYLASNKTLNKDLILEVSILSLGVQKTPSDSLYAQGSMRYRLIEANGGRLLGSVEVSSNPLYYSQTTDSGVSIRSREGRSDYQAAVNRSFEILARNLSIQALDSLTQK